MTEPLFLPEWLLVYVGRMALELESARRHITELQGALTALHDGDAARDTSDAGG